MYVTYINKLQIYSVCICAHICIYIYDSILFCKSCSSAGNEKEDNQFYLELIRTLNKILTLMAVDLSNRNDQIIYRLLS